MALVSGMYRFPCKVPVKRMGAFPYGPRAFREEGERKGAVGWVGGFRRCEMRV